MQNYQTTFINSVIGISNKLTSYGQQANVFSISQEKKQSSITED